MNTLMGIPVIVHPLAPATTPKISLSLDCPVSPEFRAEFDAWLLKMFGTHYVMYAWQGQFFINDACAGKLRNLG